MDRMLPAKTPSEAKIVTWDFMEASGVLTSPTITKSTIVGSDPGAASLSISAPLISGSDVSAMVSAGTNNCSYQLVCSVVDAAGQTHQSGAAITTTTSVL